MADERQIGHAFLEVLSSEPAVSRQVGHAVLEVLSSEPVVSRQIGHAVLEVLVKVEPAGPTPSAGWGLVLHHL